MQVAPGDELALERGAAERQQVEVDLHVRADAVAVEGAGPTSVPLSVSPCGGSVPYQPETPPEIHVRSTPSRPTDVLLLVVVPADEGGASVPLPSKTPAARRSEAEACGQNFAPRSRSPGAKRAHHRVRSGNSRSLEDWITS